MRGSGVGVPGGVEVGAVLLRVGAVARAHECFCGGWGGAAFEIGRAAFDVFAVTAAGASDGLNQFAQG